MTAGKSLVILAVLLAGGARAESPAPENGRFHYECRSAQDVGSHGRIIGRLSLKQDYDPQGRRTDFNYDLKFDNATFLHDIHPAMAINTAPPANDWEANLAPGVHVRWHIDHPKKKFGAYDYSGEDNPSLKPVAFIGFDQSREAAMPKGYNLHEFILFPGKTEPIAPQRDGFVHLNHYPKIGSVKADRIMNFYEDSYVPLEDLRNWADKNGDISAYLVKQKRGHALFKLVTTRDRVVMQGFWFDMNDMADIEGVYRTTIQPWLASRSDYKKCEMVDDD